MSVTPLYAPMLALLFIALSVRTLLLRRQLGIPVGHGDSPLMHKAMRAHANFSEYVPLALLIIFFMELKTGETLWVHAACIALVAGRSLHAYGISQVQEDFRIRVSGMALTFTAFFIAIKQLLLSYV